jgi:hypothetical protein
MILPKNFSRWKPGMTNLTLPLVYRVCVQT